MLSIKEAEIFFIDYQKSLEIKGSDVFFPNLNTDLVKFSLLAKVSYF